MDRAYSRRDWIRLAGASAATLALGGCSSSGRPMRFARAYPTTGSFVRPVVAPELAIRSVVGLRPFRPSGFVVRGERLDGKVLVHNYGHGGGGITLSWGSSALAVREVRDVLPRRAAVLGCGVMGLTTARLLQDRGWEVTIYARDLPPHTTSDVAGGQWTPVSVFDEDRLTPGFASQFAEAARTSYHAFAGLVGAGYGVRWIENYYLSRTPFDRLAYPFRVLPDLFPGAAELGPEEHPFPAPHVRRVVTMLVEPSIFLRRLLADFRQAGGAVVVREMASRADVAALAAPVVFNCTGLGAARLFGDSELTPVRGQLVFLPPDPRIDYLTVGGGAGVLYMFPRSDGLLLGGTFQSGRDDLSPDPADTARILLDHARVAEGMRVG